MLKMARRWVGRREIIATLASIALIGAIGAVVASGWWSIISATLMSLVAGMLLILLVAIPPLVVSASETGRLSAGTFLVGYTVAFVVPMTGGLVADWTGDARHAVLMMIAYGLLVLPLAFTLDLERKRASRKADPFKRTPHPALDVIILQRRKPIELHRTVSRGVGTSRQPVHPVTNRQV